MSSISEGGEDLLLGDLEGDLAVAVVDVVVSLFPDVDLVDLDSSRTSSVTGQEPST